MKEGKLLLLMVSVLCLCCRQPETQLALNSSFKEKEQVDTLIFIPNGAFVNSHTVMENGIEYTVGVQDGRIVYVDTVDKNFTIRGLRINDRLPRSYEGKEWGYRPGWGYFKEIDSGWYALFDFRKKPTEESRIEAFFKCLFIE